MHLLLMTPMLLLLLLTAAAAVDPDQAPLLMAATDEAAGKQSTDSVSELSPAPDVDAIATIAVTVFDDRQTDGGSSSSSVRSAVAANTEWTPATTSESLPDSAAVNWDRTSVIGAVWLLIFNVSLSSVIWVYVRKQQQQALPIRASTPASVVVHHH